MKKALLLLTVLGWFSFALFAQETNVAAINEDGVESVNSVEEQFEAELNAEEYVDVNKKIKSNADDSLKVFNIKLINTDDFLELVARFFFNMLFVFLVVRYLYYSVTNRKDYLFTYILISVIIFLLCFLLGNVKIQIGFALGLFAIFGIIRYRTMQMPIKEMTYLFIVIGLSIMNSLANKKVSYAELLFTNIAIFGITYLLEKVWLLRHESHKEIRYDNIDLIKPEKYAELKEDLEKRTGLKINRIEIGNVNFLTDSVKLQVYYYESDNKISALDETSVYSTDDDD